MKRSSVSVCLSICLSHYSTPAGWWVCCWGPSGQEISIDSRCCHSAAATPAVVGATAEALVLSSNSAAARHTAANAAELTRLNTDLLNICVVVLLNWWLSGSNDKFIKMGPGFLSPLFSVAHCLAPVPLKSRHYGAIQMCLLLLLLLNDTLMMTRCSLWQNIDMTAVFCALVNAVCRVVYIFLVCDRCWCMVPLNNRIYVSRLMCCKTRCTNWSVLSKCMPSDWRPMKVSDDAAEMGNTEAEWLELPYTLIHLSKYKTLRIMCILLQNLLAIIWCSKSLMLAIALSLSADVSDWHRRF